MSPAFLLQPIFVSDNLNSMNQPCSVAVVAVSFYPVHQKPISALLNGICISLGFALTAIVLGAAREFFGSGSLWGFKIAEAAFPSVKLPFWGFIFLGFLAAFVNLIKDFVKKPEEKAEEEL